MGIKHWISRVSTEVLFGVFNKNRHRKSHPDWNNSYPFSIYSIDGGLVQGWASRLVHSRGTLFVCHGFTDHSMSCSNLAFAEEAKKNHHLSIISMDFRFHGWSHNQSSSFGIGEMWDIQGVMKWAESYGFPYPYILTGESLGAMGAGRTAIQDQRVKEHFFAHHLFVPGMR